MKGCSKNRKFNTKQFDVITLKQPSIRFVQEVNGEKLKSPDERDFITNNKQIPSLAMQVSEGIPFLLSVVVRPEKNLDSFSSVISVEYLLGWQSDEVWRSYPL